ncbi:hypothetical protein EFA46_011345 (plasmid) [Halarchaeum sp. CBA1220]|uniref:hypothetical protein n=1 Tax=Halarchaeum sp. CBA1220 TaxID=1853682 RepID=UPI000F3A8D71|nr:hypothetical protein [Halarchaeum sp. CBA1220]QLC34849.1 hypothetical protein EFA46_011345 [Halarchaeum sp. CBA1220]
MLSRRRALLVLAVVAVVAVAGLLGALAALEVFALPTAIRSGYALGGALLACVAYAATRRRHSGRDALLPASVASKLVVALGAACAFAVVELDARVLPVAAFLLVAYALVADQLAGDPEPASVLLALATCFFVPAYAKYRTTGFYFGGTDTFAHVDALRRLLATGASSAIPYGYDLFPVFHVYTGTVALFSGLGFYDAIVLTGIVAYTALVPVVYLVGVRLLGDSRTALCVAAAFTVLDLPAYYAVYFFPQSFTLGLLLVGFYAVLALRASRHTSRVREHATYAVVLVATLVLTHHLTYVLLGGVLLGLAVVAALRARLPRLVGWDALASERGAWRRLRYRFPVYLGVLGVLAYLVYSPSLILYAIVGLTAQIFTDTVTAAVSVVFTYGVALPEDSVARAVGWLATPVGVYYTLGCGVLLLGAYEFLDRAESYARAATVLVGATGLAVLLLPLPVSLPQGERLQFVVVLLAVLPFGLGIARLLRAPRRHAPVVLAVALVVVAAFGASGAFTRATADDLGHDAGVYVEQRSVQVAMSDAEYAAVGDAARFLARYAPPNATASSDVVTRRAFASVPGYGGGVAGVNASARGVTAPPGYVVTREAWTDSFVPTAESDVAVSAKLQWYTVSDARYRASVATHDRVFSAAGTSVLRGRGDYRLFGNGTVPVTGGPGG